MKMLDHREEGLNLVQVMDVYIQVPGDLPHHEYNDTLTIRSSRDSFWLNDETEYKIETFESDTIPEKTTIDGFSFSALRHFTTFERYLHVRLGEKETYICILGKNGWKFPMAFKHKTQVEGDILTRRVTIAPVEEMEAYLEKLFHAPFDALEITRLPAYYKHKKRVICLDEAVGQVYGVSHSLSRPLKKDLPSLGQMEIEFWSRIVPEGEIPEPMIDPASYDRLIRLMENRLTGDYTAPGRTKTEWLKQLI